MTNRMLIAIEGHLRSLAVDSVPCERQEGAAYHFLKRRLIR
ncbi:MAG: hypothetical protein N2V78_08435 [Methanophagales archaeon]|nr:hypothetical protein [Methanophagales archaeon]